jgi:hypothetical protein
MGGPRGTALGGVPIDHIGQPPVAGQGASFLRGFYAV